MCATFSRDQYLYFKSSAWLYIYMKAEKSVMLVKQVAYFKEFYDLDS